MPCKPSHRSIGFYDRLWRAFQHLWEGESSTSWHVNPLENLRVFMVFFCWFIAWWPLVVVKSFDLFSPTFGNLWALVGGVELFVNWMRSHAPQPLIYQLIQADAKLVCENWGTNDKCQTSRRKERERESTKRRERSSDKLPQRYRKEVPEQKRVPHYSGNPLLFGNYFSGVSCDTCRKSSKRTKSKQQRAAKAGTRERQKSRKRGKTRK